MNISTTKTFICLILFLPFFLVECSPAKENETDEILIQIGNFLVYRQQYENQLKKLAVDYDEFTQKEATLFLLDNYISAGLLTEAAKKLNYDQHLEFTEKIKKPLIIHCVKAFDELVALKKKSDPSNPG